MHRLKTAKAMAGGAILVGVTLTIVGCMVVAGVLLQWSERRCAR